jgi:hypothetical protein
MALETRPSLDFSPWKPSLAFLLPFLVFGLSGIEFFM